jgi:hypothetical protein
MVGAAINIQQDPPTDLDVNNTQHQPANSNAATTWDLSAGNFAAETEMPPLQGIHNNPATAAPDTNPTPANSNQPTPVETHAAVQSVMAEEDRASRASLIATAGKSPAQALAVQKLATATGLPAEVVERNIDQVQRRATTDQARDHLAGNPSLTTQLSNPTTAKLAADDVSHLGKIETGIQLSIPRMRFGAKGPAFAPSQTTLFDDGTKPTNSSTQAAVRNFIKGGGSVPAAALRGIGELATDIAHPNNVNVYRRVLKNDPSYTWRVQIVGGRPVIAIQDRRTGGRVGALATFYVGPEDDLYKFLTNPDLRQELLQAEEKKIDPSDHFLYKAGNDVEGYLGSVEIQDSQIT